MFKGEMPQWCNNSVKIAYIFTGEIKNRLKTGKSLTKNLDSSCRWRRGNK
jgi:hypothetical protein